jgi:hypothetical protein
MPRKEVAQVRTGGFPVQEVNMRSLSIVVLSCAAIAGLGGCDTSPASPAETISVALAPTASGDGQTGEVGQLLSQGLRALVMRNGVPAEGVSVQWATSAAGSTIAPSVAQSDANGIALALWSMPTAAGPVTATASVSGGVGSPVTYHATAEAGDPASTSQAGDGQSMAVGTAASEPLTMRVADQYGNPVSGVSITWSVISGAATLSAGQVDTDAGGASAVVVTAGATAGPVLVRAIPPAPLAAFDYNLTVTP